MTVVSGAGTEFSTSGSQTLAEPSGSGGGLLVLGATRNGSQGLTFTDSEFVTVHETTGVGGNDTFMVYYALDADAITDFGFTAAVAEQTILWTRRVTGLDLANLEYWLATSVGNNNQLDGNEYDVWMGAGETDGVDSSWPRSAAFDHDLFMFGFGRGNTTNWDSITWPAGWTDDAGTLRQGFSSGGSAYRSGISGGTFPGPEVRLDHLTNADGEPEVMGVSVPLTTQPADGYTVKIGNVGEDGSSGTFDVAEPPGAEDGDMLVLVVYGRAWSGTADFTESGGSDWTELSEDSNLSANMNVFWHARGASAPNLTFTRGTGFSNASWAMYRVSNNGGAAPTLTHDFWQLGTAITPDSLAVASGDFSILAFGQNSATDEAPPELPTADFDEPFDGASLQDSGGTLVVGSVTHPSATTFAPGSVAANNTYGCWALINVAARTSGGSIQAPFISSGETLFTPTLTGGGVDTGSAGAFATISGSGQAIPTTSWADIDMGAVDVDDDGILSEASGVFTPQAEGYYLLIGEARHQITHGNRHNAEMKFQRNGADISGAVNSGYARNSTNDLSYYQFYAIAHFDGSNDTFDVQHRRELGDGSPAGTYDWTRIKVIQLTDGGAADTPFGHYGTPTSAALGGNTPTAVAGWNVITETDTATIELQAGGTAIRLKEADRPYLVVYGLPTDSNGSLRTGRISDVTLDGVRVAHSVDQEYQRDAGTGWCAPAGIALVYPDAANEDLNVRVWGHTGAPPWGTWSDGDWSLSDAAGRAGVAVIALPSTLEFAVFEDTTVGGETISSSAVTTIATARTPVNSNGTKFTRDNQDAVTVPGAHGVLAWAALLSERTASNTGRNTFAVRWQVEGVDATNFTEQGDYIRGDQGSQDHYNGSAGSAWLGTTTADDTFQLEKFDPGTDDGGNDAVEFSGSFYIDLSTLAVTGGGGGPQSLSAPFISSGEALFTPTLTQGPQQRTTPFISSGAVTFPVSLSQQAQNLAAPFISSGEVLFTPALALGNQIRELAFISSGSALFTPSLTQGAQQRTLPFLTAGSQLFTPSLAQGTQQRTLGFIASASTAFSPNVSAAGSLVLSFIPSAATLFTPELRTGAVRTLPFVASTETLFTPTLTRLQARTTLPFISPDSGAFTPSLAQTAQSRTLGFIDSTAATFSPRLGLKIPTTTLGFIPSTEVLFTPSVQIGPQRRRLRFLAPTSQTFSPSLLQDQRIELQTIESTAQLFTPFLINDIPVTTLSLIGPTANVYTPSVANRFRPPPAPTTVRTASSVRRAHAEWMSGRRRR